MRFARRGLLCAAVACAGLLPAGPADAQTPPIRPVVLNPGTLRILYYSRTEHHPTIRLGWSSGVSLYDILHRLCDSYGAQCSTWRNFGSGIQELHFPRDDQTLEIPYGGRWQSQIRFGLETHSSVSTINYDTMPPSARPSTSPRSLSVSVGGDAGHHRTAALSWRHAFGATHYQVRYCEATRNGAGVYTKGRCDFRTGGRDSEGWFPAQAATGDTAIQRATVSPLVDNSYYYLEVRGRNGHGVGPAAGIGVSTPPFTPLTPTGLAASSVTHSSATLSWGAVSHAGHYQVRTCAATQSGSTYTPGACGSWSSNLTATTYTFTGLSLSSTSSVFLQVRALNSDTGASPGTHAGLRVFLQPPGTPPSVAASSVTHSSATLSWGAASHASHYQTRTCAATRSGSVYTRGVCGDWSSNQTATTHTFTGLSQTTSYMLQVRAYNASGTSAASEVGIQTYHNRCAAAEICITSRGRNSLTVEWDPSSYGDIVWLAPITTRHFHVGRGDIKHYVAPSGSYSYEFTGLQHDTAYTFKVGRVRSYIREIVFFRSTLSVSGRTTDYRHPTASAGTDQSNIAEGASVTLSGSGTLSPDRPGQTLRYAWSQTAGPDVTLSSASAQNPTFTAPTQLATNTTLTFSLTVNDGLVYSRPDTVDVEVTAGENDAPTANAGDDQRLAEDIVVTLDASGSSDPEGSLTYAWSQTGTPAVTLSSSTDVKPTFTSPTVTEDTTLTFSLTVTDLGGLSATDTVDVTVLHGANVAPTADAGDNQTVDEGDTVTLDASDSSDPENQVMRYTWSQTGGPAVTLSSSTAQMPTFTAPQVVADDNVLTFSLTVNDHLQDSALPDTVTVTVTPGPNAVPTADAGDNQTVDEVTTVTLGGSGSDPENRPLNYAWTQTGGTPTVGLSAAAAATTTFTAPDVSGNVTLTFSLTVNDGVHNSAADTVDIMVRGDANAAPTANAGTNQTVNEGDTVTLGGSGSDPDPEDTTLSYVWTQTAGPTVTLGDATAATTTFTAPDVSADAALVFSLTVVDSHGTSSPPAAVTVTVTVPNDAPTADAGDPRTVNQGATVTLDASDSSDPENLSLTYAWRQTAGPTVTISDVAAQMPTFAAPDVSADTGLTFSLTVNDGVHNSAADTVTVTVRGDAPTAEAGNPQTVVEGATVTLDGSASSDPGNRPLTYSWTQTGGTPTVTLSGTPARPTFTAPNLTSNGTLTFSLTVTAAGTTSVSAADTVTVTVTADDDPPTADAGDPQTVNERVTVTLDGSGSSDPESGALTYAWSQTGTPAVTLSSTSAARPTFTAPALTANATLTFSLTVTDAAGAVSVADTVTVTVNNLPDLRVTGRGSNWISVAWDAVSGVRYQGVACWHGLYDRLICIYDPDQGFGRMGWFSVGHGTHTFTGLSQQPNHNGRWLLKIRPVGGSEISVWARPGTVTVRPTADAGDDQTVDEGATVTLDGGTSSSGVTYAWRQTAGPTVALSSTTAASTTFTAPQFLTDGELTFSLTVTNSGNTASLPDTVTVTVRAGINDPPTADAGDPLTVAEGMWARLDGGGSSDPENGALTYSWTPPEGVTLSSASARSPTFVAPEFLRDTPITFSLTVNDGVQDSALPDTVTVTVTADNDAPTADAGDPQTVDEGDTVTLDGSGSSDPEGQSLTYAWRQTAGPTVTISSASVARPTFTAPEFLQDTTLTFSLTVIDAGGAASQPGRQVVTVTADDDPPTADAGDPQTVDEGATVTLDGSGSSDPEGQSLTYAWRQTAGPTVTLSSTTAARPTFTAPDISEKTVLTFSLAVTADLASHIDTVKVTVNPLAGVKVSATSLTVAEAGSSSYTVVLAAAPASGKVVDVDVSSDNRDVRVSTDGGTTISHSAFLVFNSSDWNSPRTVTVSAVEDEDAIADVATLTHTLDATSTTDDDYDSVTVENVEVTVTDNDEAGVKVSATSLAVAEAGSSSYTVVLTSAPALSKAVEVDISSTGSADVTVSMDGGTTKSDNVSLSFNVSNWNSPQTVTVSAAEDEDAIADAATITHTVDAAETTDDDYDSVTVDNVAVNVTEADSAGISVGRSGDLWLTEEGTAGTYALKLAAKPAGDVVVRVSSGDDTSVKVNKSGGTEGTSQDFTFTTTNWNAGQDVTLTAVEDADSVGEEVTITHAVEGDSSSDEYDSAGPVTFRVNVTDADGAGISVGRSGALPLTEEGTAGTYALKLTTEPAGDVVVRVSSGDDTSVKVNKSGGTEGTSQDFTFTTTNWNAGQDVTLTAVEDADSVGEEVTITHAVEGDSSSDEYDSAGSVTFRVNVTDADSAATISATNPVSLTEANIGGATVTVTLSNATYVADANLGTEDFELSSKPAGVTISEVSRSSDTEAVLTLAYDDTDPDNDFDTNAKLRVKVKSAGHEGTGDLTTAEIDVTAVVEAAPAKPTGLSATAGDGKAVLKWTDPENADITSWEYSYRLSTAQRWKSWTAVSGSGASTVTATVTELVNGSAHDFRIRAVVAKAPDGAASETQSATPATLAATISSTNPVSLTESNIDGATVTVTLSNTTYTNENHGTEDFELSSKPAGVRIKSHGVSRSSDTVAVLTLVYDDTADFDADAKLGVKVLDSGHTKTGDLTTGTIAVTATVEPAAAKPTGLSARNGNGQVFLSWTNPGDAAITGYEYQSRNSGGSWSDSPWVAMTGSGAGTVKYTVGGLTNGQGYDFRIRALRTKADPSAASDAVSETPTAATALITATNPSRLTEANIDGATVTVTLAGATYVASGLDKNDFELSSGPAGVTISGARRTSNTSAVLTLAYGDTDDFDTDAKIRVRALDSGHTDAADLTTGGETVTAVVEEKPVAPMGLVATGWDMQVVLKWTNPGIATITGWEYKYRPSGTSYSLWTAVAGGAGVATVTVTGLTNGSAYDFQVRAVAARAPDGGAGAASGTVTATPAAGAVSATITSTDPSFLTETDLDGAEVTVELAGTTYVASGLDKNDFELSSGPAGVTISGASRSSDTAAVLTLAYDDTDPDYDFDTSAKLGVKVLAAGHAGSGDITTGKIDVRALVEPAPGAPADLAAAAGNLRATLSWTDPGNANITSWEYRKKLSDAGRWGPWMAMAGSGADTTSYVVRGLSNGREYNFQIRAVDAKAPDGTASATASATPAEAASPSTTTWKNPDATNNWQAQANAWDVVTTSLAASATSQTVTFTFNYPADTSQVRRYDVLACPWSTATVSDTENRPTGCVDVVDGSTLVTGTTRFSGNLTPTRAMIDNGGVVFVMRYELVTMQGSSRITVSQNVYAEWVLIRGSASITGTNPAELTEGSLNGATVTVDLSGLDFNSGVAAGDFELTGVPSGATVSITGAARDSTEADVAVLTLSYTGDYDEAFSLGVKAKASGHTGSSDLETGTVRVAATVEAAASITAQSADPLTEENIGGATVTVELVATTYVASGLDKDDFELASKPAGVTISSVSRTSNTVAVVTLSYDGSEFDTDEKISVRVLASGHTGTGNMETGERSVTAVVETTPAKPAGLTATGGDGEVVLKWTDPGNPKITKWQYRKRTPSGSGNWDAWVDVSGSSATTRTVTVPSLTNDSAYDFQVRAFRSKADPEAGEASDEATATPMAPAAAISSTDPSSLTEGTLNGATVTVSLSRTTYVAEGTLDTTHFELPSKPTGVTISGVSRSSDTAAVVTLAFTDDFDEDEKLSVKVLAAGHAKAGDLTTPEVDVTAAVEAKVSGVSITSTPSGGSGDTYGPGEEIRVVVSFNDPNVSVRLVTSEGKPYVELGVGEDTRRAVYDSSSRGRLEFGYTVQSTDTDTGGVSIAAGALKANTASIGVRPRRPRGSVIPAELSLSGFAVENDSDHKVDGSLSVPAKPTELSASAGVGEAALTWTGPTDSGITGWEYRYKSDGGTWSLWKAVTGGVATTRSATVDGLTGGESYSFQVRAKNGDGASAASDATSSVTVLGMAITVSPSPLAEHPVTLMAGAKITVTLKGAITFNSVLTAGNFELVTNVPGLTISGAARKAGNTKAAELTLAYDGTDFDTDRKVSVKVKESAHSGTAELTTATEFPVTATDEAPPDAITGLAAYPRDGVVVLTWTHPSDTAISYEYRHRKTGDSWPASWTALARAASNTHRVSGLENGSAYEFEFRGVTDRGGAGASVSVTATPNPVSATITGTSPATVTEGDLGGATVTVGVTGTTFNSSITKDDFEVSGITGLGIKASGGVSRSSDTEAVLTLAYSGTGLTADGAFTVKVRHGSHLRGGNLTAGTVTVRVVPGVSGVSFTGTPPVNSTWRGGEKIVVDVEFSPGVTVTGTPRLGLGIGSNTRQATYESAGSTSTRLRFGYVVQSADTDTDGVSIAATALGLNGGSIVHSGASGVNAALGLGTHAVTDDSDHKVDGSIAAYTISVSPSGSLTLGEGGSGGTYDVKLSLQPVIDVVVDVSSDNADVTVSKDGGTTKSSNVMLTFNRTSWNAAQTITVYAGEDDDAGDDSATLTYSVVAESSSNEYDSAPDVTRAVSVTDDDEEGVTTSKSSATINESGTGNSFTYNVKLKSEPTGNVTVTPASSPLGLVTVSPASLTFTKTDWNVDQEVTVTAVDNDVDDASDRAGSVTHSVSGADYATGETLDSVSVTLTDKDTAAVVVSAVSGQATEAGGTAKFTVKLATQPTAAVTIDVTSKDTGEGTVSPAELTFTTTNWGTTQEVTVTGVDDSLVDGTQTYYIELGAPTSTDSKYSTLLKMNVSVKTTDNDAPGVTISETGVTVTEASSGRTARYTVVLNTQPTGTVTVTPTSGDGSVATVSPAELTFTASGATIWSTPQEVTVTGVDNHVDNPSDLTTSITHAVTGADYETAGVTADPVSVTLTDDDATPTVTLSLSDTSISENGGTSTVTASLSGASSEAVILAVGASPSSGLSLSSNTTLTIAAGSTASTGAVTITATDDTTDALDKTVSVTATVSGTSGVSNPSDVTLTITDDDDPPSLSISSPSVTEGDSGSVTLTFEVTLSAASGKEITVDYADAGSGTATSGTDYTALTSGTLTFIAGDTSKDIAVSVTGDTLDEANETVVVTISSASNATISTATGTGTITDDDATPTVTLSLSSTSISENGGTSTVTASLSGASSEAVILAVGASPSSGFSLSTNTTLTIAAGSTASTGAVTITATDDTTDAADKTVSVTATVSGTSGVADPSAVTLTITDDDAAPSLSISSPSVTEGDSGSVTLTFEVTLSAASGKEITVDYADAGSGTATSGTDYTALASGTLTFSVGDTSKDIAVSVTGDTLDEANETVVVTISSASNATISTATGTGTITDDDAAPTVTLALASSTISENGGTTTVTATLSHASSQDTTVTLTAVAGLYTLGSDKTITISAGDTANSSDTATINAVNDNIDNVNDRTGTVTATATNSQGVGAVSGASLTLTDDDTAGVTVSKSSVSVTEQAAGVDYTVVLNSKPSANVTVSISSDNTDVKVKTGTGTPSGSITLTFRPTGSTELWSAAQTVTVTAVDDSDNQNETATLTQSIGSGSASEYTGVGVSNVNVQVTDNDTPGVTISETGVTVTEASGSGRTARYTVVLNTQPTGNVTVTPASGDGSVATVSAALTFTQSNWSTDQDVTVTGVDNKVDNASDLTTSITHAVSGADYGGVSAGTVNVTLTDDDTKGVTVSKSGTPQTITESGADNSFKYTVKLTSEPTGTVTVTPASSPAGLVTVSPTPLTFTTTNWGTTQEVTVTAVDDDVDDATDRTGSVTHAVSGADYATGVTAGSVSVTLTDDDTKGVVISETAITLAESGSGSSALYTVKLSSKPSGTVTVTPSVTGGVVTFSPSSLSFTTQNWGTTQEVTLTAIDDDVDDASARTGSVTHAVSGADYVGVSAGTVNVTLTDDDTKGVVISETAITLAESGSGNSLKYTVKLSSKPTGNVTVTPASSPAGLVTVSPTPLTFTQSNWGTDQEVTVTAVDDDVDNASNRTGSVTHAVSGADYATGVTAGSVSVTLTDDDTAGVTVSKSSVSVTEEGAAGDYTVVLTTQPSANVTVEISSGDATSVKVSKDGGTTRSSSVTLTFRPTGSTELWSAAQTVTVTAEDDSDSQGETVTLTQSIGSGSASEYSSVSVSNVNVQVTDNDAPNIEVTQTAALALAEGVSGTYNVRLTTEPASDVLVSVSSDNTDVTVKTGTGTPSGSITLTFTQSNWNTDQEVTVEAGEDTDLLDESAEITHAVVAQGSSDEYDSVSAVTFTVNVTDNDYAGLSIADAEASESAGTLDFTVTKSMESSRTVTVVWTLAAGTATAADYDDTTSSDTLTFSAGETSKTISVPINDDFLVEGDETVTVTLSNQNPSEVTISGPATGTIKDDDTAGASVTPERSLRSTTEDNAGTVQLGVALSSKPGAAVTVTVTSSDTTEGIVKASEDAPDPTLEFTPADWDTPQTVTVTGVDDEELDGDVEYNIRLAFSTAASPGGDADYRGLDPMDVPFTNLDDDLSILSISGGGEVTEGDTGSSVQAVFTVSLAPARHQEVSVSYATADGTAEAGSDYTAASGTVTFSPGEISRTVAVTVNGDDEAEANETFSVTLTGTPDGQIDSQNSSAEAVIVNDDEKMVDASMSGEFSVGDTTVTVDSTLPADTGLEVVLPSELESGGAVIEELTVTLGPTDEEIDADLFGYTGTDDDHVLVDIDVSPVPDAAVRVCLPVTEGLRRAAGEQRLYLIRFSGGSWGELSSTTEENMVCADVNGFSPFALVYQIDFIKRRFGEVNRAILPELARAMTSSALEAITARIEAVMSGGPDVNSLNVQSPHEEEYGHIEPGLRLGEFEDGETLSLLDSIDGSRFSLSLARGYDLAEGGGESSGSRSGGLGMWISGDYRNLSGKGGGLVDWDGRLVSGHLGADYRFGQSFLAGVATSWSQGSFDYTGRGDGTRVSGDYGSRMNSFHPYLGLSLSRRLGVWAAGGWGFGEIRIDDGEVSGRRRAATRLGTLATGADLQLLGSGATTLSLKGEAWISRMRVKDNGGRIEGLRVKTNRLRATLEGSHALAFGSGSSLIPSLEFGIRRDGGDGETGVGGELGGGIVYASSFGLAVEARGRTLLFHQGDTKEWGLGGSVSFDPGGDGRGLSMSVLPTYGNSSSGVQGLWESETAADLGASGSAREFGLETEVGYGFPMFGDGGLLTPYGAFGRPDPDSRNYRFGGRFSMNRTIDLTLEGQRRELRAGAPEHELTIQGRFNW